MFLLSLIPLFLDYYINWVNKVKGALTTTDTVSIEDSDRTEVILNRINERYVIPLFLASIYNYFHCLLRNGSELLFNTFSEPI